MLQEPGRSLLIADGLWLMVSYYYLSSRTCLLGNPDLIGMFRDPGSIYGFPPSLKSELFRVNAGMTGDYLVPIVVLYVLTSLWELRFAVLLRVNVTFMLGFPDAFPKR